MFIAIMQALSHAKAGFEKVSAENTFAVYNTSAGANVFTFSESGQYERLANEYYADHQRKLGNAWAGVS